MADDAPAGVRWHHPAIGAHLYGASITADGQLIETDPLDTDGEGDGDEDGDGPVFTSEEKRARAHSTFLRLVLAPYTIHFKAPAYIQPATLELLDKRVVKETLRLSSQDVWVRTGIGSDARYWHELVVLLQAAVPSLERRSFQGWDPSSVDYDSTSGALIAANYPGLWRDVERVNDMVSIARNVLTIGIEAQDLASAYCADLELFRLVNCCVRVTARGYDGNAGTGEEEKWQWVVNAYKKLLITSLQLLNNLVAQNERKRCMLWHSLFDHTSDSGYREENVVARTIPPPKKPSPPISNGDIILAYGSNGPGQRVSPFEYEAAQLIFPEEGFKALPANAVAAKKHAEPNGYVYFTSRHKATLIRDFETKYKRTPTLGEIHRNIPHYWHAALKENSRLWSEWQELFDRALDAYRDDEDDYADYLRDPDGWQERFLEGRAPPPPDRELSVLLRQAPDGSTYIVPSYDVQHICERINTLQESMAAEVQDQHAYSLESLSLDTSTTDNNKTEIENPMDPTDLMHKFSERMPFTANAGSKILESGKGELMRRLEGWVDVGKAVARTNAEVRRERSRAERRGSSAGAARSPHALSTGPVVEDAFAEESLNGDQERDDPEQSEDDDNGEDDDEEEDYPGSTEDGRGLLTDVPLILGPSEIEVLPMMIMSGVVAPHHIPGNRTAADEEEYMSQPATKFRCHLLLSSTSGRNLLRELLIFVAAWDLREEELYFKFMVRILEAILKFGLMPYAYHAFRDRSRSKDIISPAQAVIMKLLTCIFRGRNDLIRRHIRGEVLDGQSPSFALRQSLGDLAGTFSGATVEGRDEIKRQHERAVQWKQWLGVLPSSIDLRLLNYIFTEFRQHIIPQTCALIFLQGQIHRGKASAEDFPLNLWDMERMYEGVYQFLEFFAVLTEDTARALGDEALASRESRLGTKLKDVDPKDYLPGNLVFIGDETAPIECNGEIIWSAQDCRDATLGMVKSWRDILAQWEMASELIILMRELENGIPRAGRPPVGGNVTALQSAVGPASSSLPGVVSTVPPAKPRPQRSMSVDAAMSSAFKNMPLGASAHTAVAVERPFDMHSSDLLQQLPASLTPGLLPPIQPQSIFEAETPLAYPEDHLNLNPAAGLPSVPGHAASQPAVGHDQDEPSNFEWRNLKKLSVLVLSSLLVKQSLVREQVRRYSGLEALVACCRPDENNPYIREHAIVCLRLAVEDCKENARVLIKLAQEKNNATDGSSLNALKKGQKMLTVQPPGPENEASVGTRPSDSDDGFDAFLDNKGRTCLRRRRDGVVVAVEGEIDPAATVESLLTAPPAEWDGVKWDGRPESVTDRTRLEAKGYLPRLANATSVLDEAALAQEKDIEMGNELFRDALIRSVVGDD